MVGYGPLNEGGRTLMAPPANSEALSTAGTTRGGPRFSLFRWLGGFAIRFRFLIVLVWVLATVVATLTLPSLSSVTDTNNLSFLPANSPSLRAAQLAGSFQQGTLPTAVIVASRSRGRFSAADQAAITRVEAAVSNVDGVLRVVDQGVSNDGQARKALLILKGDALGGGPALRPYVQNIRATFDRVNAPVGLQLALTGEVATLYDQSQSNQSTQRLTELLSVLFIIVLLAVIYRSLLAPVLTLLPAGLVLTLSQPVIAESHSVLAFRFHRSRPFYSPSSCSARAPTTVCFSFSESGKSCAAVSVHATPSSRASLGSVRRSHSQPARSSVRCCVCSSQPLASTRASDRRSRLASASCFWQG